MSFCTNCGTQLAGDGRFCTGCGMALSLATPTATTKRSVWAVFGGLAAFGLFGCLLTCTALILLLEVPDPVALGLSTAAAVLPAGFYSALVLFLDRYEKEPWYTLVGAFAWGAIVAVVFSYFFNSLSGAVVASVHGLEAGEFFSLAVAAPFYEELFKGAALLLLLLLFRHEFDNVLDGIVYGALVGLGFAMTENIIYFGRAYFEAGIFGLGILFVLRVVIGGLAHALYTATTGAALGWSRSRYGRGTKRIVVPLLGLGLAMLQHSLWNTTAYFIGRIDDEMFLIALLLVVFVEPLVLLFPALAGIIILAAVTSRREIAIIQEQLAGEVERGVITANEFDLVSRGNRRTRAGVTALLRGGPALWLAQRRFIRLAAQLAFQKHHASRGEIGRRGLAYRSPEELRKLIGAARVRAQGRNINASKDPANDDEHVQYRSIP